MKIFFHLDQDQDGWPPAAVESVWAHSTDVAGECVIDNIPFFTSDATQDDTVAVRRDDDGTLWFERMVRHSRNSLVRIILLARDQFDIVREALERYGCSMEYFSAYSLLAVNIPPNANLNAVIEYLEAQELAGHIAYEEAILWESQSD